MTRLLRLLCLVLALCAGGLASGLLPAPFGAPAAAQTQPEAIDYDEWESVATRAESAVEAALASTDTLEQLRAEIVGWRERFLAAQDTNAARIATLRDQIEALGPLPEEGLTEAEEIATRRKDLNDQLNAALVPVRTAEEAYRRAEGIIRQIDTIVRARQAGELLAVGPSPANPALWPDAAQELLTAAENLVTETTRAWDSDLTRQTFMKQLPQTLLYLLIAAALVVRGRPTMVWLTQTVLSRSRGRARWLAGFITSLFQVVVPLLGLLLLTAALINTGLMGMRGQALAGSLTLLGLYVFPAWWLALRLYPLHADAPRPMPGTFDRAREMRFYITVLGLMLGFIAVLQVLVKLENFTEGTTAVIFFPLIALVGLTFVRVGRILSNVAVDDADESVTFAQRGQRLIGQVLLIVGILAPLGALLGYRNAAMYMIVPTGTSLALLGLLRILHDIVVELYALLTRKTTEDAKQALWPSVISFVLVIAALPLFALAWGTRVADLSELYARFMEGVSIGEARISPTTFLTFLVVFAVLFAGTRLFQSALKTTILPKTRIDPGGQNAIVSGIGYLGIGLGALIAITTAGVNLSALAVVFGALSVGIGFGLQNIVSNFVSGIILLVERPVAEGDWIEVGGHMGIVKDISVRSTRIETFDRNDVIVPNADFISGAVKNWTRGNSVGRIIVTVGVAYGTDTRKVERILMEIAMEHPLVALDPEPAVDFLEFGASSLDFQMRMILRDIAYGLAVRTEIRHRIAERFAEEGIEIPFAQQDIWLRNPEALRLGKAVVPDAEPAAPETTEEPDAPPAASDAGTGHAQAAEPDNGKEDD